VVFLSEYTTLTVCLTSGVQSNLTAFNNYTAAWTRAYDADNRETGEYIGPTRIVAHSYDAAGQKGLLSTTTDTDGRVLSYAYTARNELASVSEAAGTTSYAYDAAGNQTHLYLPNGARTDQYYNNNGTLDRYYNWDGQNAIYSSYGYGYNADTQITGCNEALNYAPYGSPNVSPTTYGYDSQGHLTGENRTGSSPNSQGYSYNGAGNLTNVSGVNPFTYDADDEVTSVGGSNVFGLTYNANGDRTGETINGQATTFTYDFDDRLMSLTAGGTTMTYRYDALGRQVSRSVNGALTGFYLNGDQSLVEKGPTGGTTQYTWGNGLIRCNGEYPLTDGRGNVRLTLDGGRYLTSSNVPDAFGIGSFTSGTASVYQWNGGVGYRTEGLAPTGLSVAYSFQKVGARYYDPTLKCFLTRDTELGQKPYAYCDGDPVNHVDPSGHSVLNILLSSAGVSIGPFHLDGGFGIAVQFPGFGANSFGFETYATGNAGFGIGLGAAVSPYFGGVGFGKGNLNGFNGASAFGGIYADPFGSLSYSRSLGGGYQGIQVGLPKAGLQVGVYGGLGTTRRLFGGGGQF